MNKKRILFLNIIMVFLIILVSNYYNNYNLLKQPPSKKWSKEVQIGSGLGKNTPIVIKEENRLLVAYEDTKKIKICEMDLKGAEIKTTEYDVEEELLKNLIFTKNDGGYILMYNGSKSGTPYLESIVLDKELNMIKKETEEGILLTEQIDSENIALSYKDKIKVVNTVTSEYVEVPVENVTMLTANKNKDDFFDMLFRR
jgi:cell division protein YceG involved in septum cleavage